MPAIEEHNENMVRGARTLVEEYERMVKLYQRGEDGDLIHEITELQELFESSPTYYTRTHIDSDGVVHYRVNRFFG